MVKWKTCTLGDLGAVIGGATPSTKKPENYDGGEIPWLTPKDLSGFPYRYIARGGRNITEQGLKSCSARLLPKGTVLFTSRAPIGYIAIAENELCTNQGFKSVIPNENTDSLFLYYLLKCNEAEIERMGSGTTFKEVSGSVMRSVQVRVPEDIRYQRRISGLLGLLDDKIELNTRMNANLERQAGAIYADMFITRAGALWKRGRLSDLVRVRYGKDHKKLADGKIPVYGSGGLMRYAERALYARESVLIPRKGTLNNVMYVSEPFWTVDTMFYTEILRPNAAKFAYHFLRRKNLAAMNAGSAVPSMTADILNAMELRIPDDERLADFEETVSPMYRAMSANEKQSGALITMRDALLPRLMSGELDASKLPLAGEGIP